MTQGDLPDSHAWMKRAYSNLSLAQKRRGKDIMLEDLCFNAQQAVEKALKAVCIFRKLDFPKTHSIVRLLDIIESSGVALPESVKSADILTQYAVQTRYPGPIEEVTIAEYKEALELAAKVVFWADTFISTQ